MHNNNKTHNTKRQINVLITHRRRQTHISVRNCGFLCKQQMCAFNADSDPLPFGKTTLIVFQETQQLHHYLAANYSTQTKHLLFTATNLLLTFTKHTQSQWDSSSAPSALQFSKMHLLRKSQDIQYGRVTSFDTTIKTTFKKKEKRKVFLKVIMKCEHPSLG